MTKLATICFFLLAIFIVGLGCVSSTRILFADETGSATAVPLGTTTYDDETPSSAVPTASGTDSEDTVDDGDVADAPLPDVIAPVADVAPVATPTDTSSDVAAPTTVGQQPQMTFFMHDIVGGSHPSVRTVTGVITSTDLNAVPFSKPANNIFPLTGN